MPGALLLANFVAATGIAIIAAIQGIDLGATAGIAIPTRLLFRLADRDGAVPPFLRDAMIVPLLEGAYLGWERQYAGQED